MTTTKPASPGPGPGAGTAHQAAITPAPSGGLSPTERAACAVCADALATHRLWGALALGCGLAVLLLSLAVPVPGGRLGVAHPFWPLPALLVLSTLERFLASRVQLDARLFDRLARGELPCLAELDTGLQQVLGVPAARAGRPLAPRIEGARRLYRLHLGAAAALALLALSAGWPG
jgi:hypothetical protein